MMSLDCPLEIRHKKGEYRLMEIGGVFKFWSFRALDCIKVLHPAFILLSFFFYFMGCIC